MTVSIDVTGVPPGAFAFSPSPLAELGSVLHALVEPDHHPEQSGWLTVIRAGLDPALLERILDADYLWRTSRADTLLPATPRATLAEELADWDEIDDDAWVRAALITSSCGSLAARPELGSPLTDPRALALARERAVARGSRQLAFVDTIVADPARARTRITALLNDCAGAFFDGIWRRIASTLEAEARRRRDQLDTLGLSPTLASISSALRSTERRVEVDKLLDSYTTAASGLTFIPTIFGRPHLLVVHTPGWRPVVQYPLTGARVSDSPATLDVLQQRLHALDHPVRLRIARSLISTPRTTSELAETWQLTRPEISRHLALLRAAGLLTAVRNGRYVAHQLDAAAVARIGDDLIDALLR
jgi:DNA-binding transcriptional ArsR family regulator